MKATEKNVSAEALEEVFIPKSNKHDDAQYVAVNGRRILVKKGETVKQRASVAGVIRHSDQAAGHAEGFIVSGSAED